MTGRPGKTREDQGRPGRTREYTQRSKRRFLVASIQVNAILQDIGPLYSINISGFPLDIDLEWHHKKPLWCHPEVQIQKGVFVIFLQPLFTNLTLATTMASAGYLLAYRSHQTLPSSAPLTPYDGIDPCYSPACLTLALGANNTTNGSDMASDDDGGNG